MHWLFLRLLATVLAVAGGAFLGATAGWRLQAPAQYAQNGSNWTLSRSCFASSSGGSLCATADWPRHGLDVTGSGVTLSLAEP